MAIHVLAVIAITHHSIGCGGIEEILHARRHIFAEFPFAGELARGLERHEYVTGDGGGMPLLFIGQAPRTVWTLLRGKPLQRTPDHRVGLVIDDHRIFTRGGVGNGWLRGVNAQAEKNCGADRSKVTETANHFPEPWSERFFRYCSPIGS